VPAPNHDTETGFTCPAQRHPGTLRNRRGVPCYNSRPRSAAFASTNVTTQGGRAYQIGSAQRPQYLV
jgi:hypothetical protein